MTHLLRLSYTNDDDGIWLTCASCGWERNVGFVPTLNDVVAAASEHDPA